MHAILCSSGSSLFLALVLCREGQCHYTRLKTAKAVVVSLFSVAMVKL